MKNKTYKILNLIARYIANHKTVYEEELINDLLDMGFELKDIDTAIYWMESFGMDISKNLDISDSRNYVRILTYEESNSLTKEAVNYLYILKKKGLIDSDMFEDILEKVIIADLDIKIDIEEIKLLTALTAYNSNNKLFNYVVENDGEVIYN